MTQNVTMIITAGGMSTRHPPNKLLNIIGDDKVIEKTILQFIKFPIRIIVVTGFERSKILKAVSAYSNQILVVHNPKYKSGISTSIRTGVLASDDPDYYGFCNGDKPFIETRTIRRLVEILNEKLPDILYPINSSIPGHPVFFKQSFKTQLLALEGDEGGRQIINENRKKVTVLSTQDTGVILDMDRFLDDQNDG